MGAILCGCNPMRVQFHVVQFRAGSIPCGSNPVRVQSHAVSIPWVRFRVFNSVCSIPLGPILWVQFRVFNSVCSIPLGSIPWLPYFVHLSIRLGYKRQKCKVFKNVVKGFRNLFCRFDFFFRLFFQLLFLYTSLLMNVVILVGVKKRLLRNEDWPNS